MSEIKTTHPVRNTVLGLLATVLLTVLVIWYQENH